MKKTFIFILFASILLASCSVLNTQEEKISSITIERYGMFTMQEYAFQKITINETSVLYETFYPNLTKTGEAFTNLTQDQFNSLTQTLNEIDFKSLNPKYSSETPVADVGGGKITISYDDSSKIIEIDPFISHGNPIEISKLIDSIQEITNNANFPQREELKTLTLKYQGVQCEDEFFETWYKEGNINYVQEPTNEHLILDYYSSKGIGIFEIRTLENGAVCEACGVCSDNNYFEIDVYENQLEEFELDGWVLVE